MPLNPKHPPPIDPGLRTAARFAEAERRIRTLESNGGGGGGGGGGTSGGSGLGFNVKNYGAIGDGTTDDTAAVHAARDALVAAGGGFLYFPFGTYRGAFVFSANVKMHVYGTGATLKPLTGGIALQISIGDGSTIRGCVFEGFLIEGSGVTGTTTGIQVVNSDRVTLRNCDIQNLTTGVEAKSDAGGWVEALKISESLIINCTTGIYYNKTATGEGSFGECELDNVGINNCTTGLKANQDASLYRTSFQSVTFWLGNSQVGMSLDCNLLDADWQVSFEGFAAGTSTVCIDLLTHATNAHLATVLASYVGNFGTDVRIASGQLLNVRRGTVNVIVTGDGRGLRTFRSGDSWPRVDVQTQQVGGGGVGFGDGTASPDVNVFRYQAGLLATDSHFRISGTSKLFQLMRAADSQPYTQVEEGKVQFGPGGSTAVDTNVYRYQADLLATDDNFRIIGTSRVLQVIRAADANPYTQLEEAKLQFGAGGGSAVDTNIYRSAADILATDDDLAIAVAGKGLRVKEGTNAKMGTATMNGTTAVVVSTTAVTANSRIFLTYQLGAGTVGAPYVSARTAGTSFSIKSTTAGDTSTCGWLIVEPA